MAIENFIKGKIPEFVKRVWDTAVKITLRQGRSITQAEAYALRVLNLKKEVMK